MRFLYTNTHRKTEKQNHAYIHTFLPEFDPDALKLLMGNKEGLTHLLKLEAPGCVIFFISNLFFSCVKWLPTKDYKSEDLHVVVYIASYQG